MTNTDRDKRRHDLRGYATLLREARSHAMGAQSRHPSPVLGEIVNHLGTLESEAMRELHRMLREDHA